MARDESEHETIEGAHLPGIPTGRIRFCMRTRHEHMIRARTRSALEHDDPRRRVGELAAPSLGHRGKVPSRILGNIVGGAPKVWCVESDDGGNRNSCVNSGLGVNDFAITRVYREENPNLPMADLLIVMGSPTSVANGHAGANALAEVAQVKEWLAAGRPYLGL